MILHITQYNETPLHYAAMRGHSDIVQILLTDGANTEAINKVTNKY